MDMYVLGVKDLYKIMIYLVFLMCCLYDVSLESYN